jgi:DNA-binding MarR family transcriptional regulator
MENQYSLENIIATLTSLMAEMETQAFQVERFAQLSMRQMYYLSAIVRLESPTFSELAHTLGVSKPSVTAIVTTLIHKGLVEKVQDDQDRRTYHIVLTPQGVQFNQLHETVHQQMGKILTANLSEQEIATLTQLLSKASQR